ncbi:SusC/RagA family TonB-linked outer membrane protein [Pedobacter yulinensis]|nr:TonB-dependent receptor [Pedobacter yulinensis]
MKKNVRKSLKLLCARSLRPYAAVILSGCMIPLTSHASLNNHRPAAFSARSFRNVASWVLKGKVVDENGDALAGASVRVKNSTRNMVTDVSGNFIIEIEQESEILVISYVGYKTKEQLAGTLRTVTIRLEPDEENQKLNEVVVVGFGKQKKVSVTGAVSEAPIKNIQRIATPSLSNALAGSMPGIVTRQASGEPGFDGGQVFIRGFGTWANRSPLILVDGVQRDINTVNVQEVESLTMLKDASATAVYGVQGANGVILITTKRGALGKPKVIFRTETAALTAMRMPEYINGGEYASLINEARANVALPARYTPEEIRKFYDGSDPYLYPNVDWTNTVLKKNTWQSLNNLGVSGGNEIVKYYTNVGYTIQNGIYRQDPSNIYNNNAQLQRYNYRSNVDINLSKTLAIDLGVGGIIQQGNYPGRSAPAIFDALKVTSPINFPVTNPDGSIAGKTTSYLQNNPYGFVTRSGYTRQDRNTIQGTFGARWDLGKLLTQGLSLNGRFAYDHSYAASTDRFKAYAIRQYLGKDAAGKDIYASPNIREEQAIGYGLNNGASRAIYQEASANYNRAFGKHTLTGLLLYNRREYIDLTASSSINNLPYRRQGIAARATYAYDKRYLAEFNMGYNGSENFPDGKQYGFFPSGSVGWVVSNEKFWNPKVINNLKIRASYGQVGNDAIGGRRFLFLTTINKGGQSTFFGDNQAYFQGYDEDQIGNADVTWEVSNKANLGLDLELFNGAITLQVDAFKEKRNGILIQRGVIPRVTGFYPWAIPYANLGEAKNHGLDGMLEFKQNFASSFFYNVRGTFTYARSILVKNDDPIPKYDYQSFIGQRIDQPLGLVALGFFKDQAEIDASPQQKYMTNVRPGDIKYQDTNGDNVIDDFDRVPIGYARTPEIVYGAGGTIGYKGFELGLFFTGAANVSTFVDGPSMYPFQMGEGTYNILREYYDNRWTPSNPEARYPRASPMENPNNNRTNSLYLRNGAYLRLKSAEVAYGFKISGLRRFGLESVRAFVNGMNLITWDHIKVIDPESNYGTGGYPLQRSINGGLQLTF